MINLEKQARVVCDVFANSDTGHQFALMRSLARVKQELHEAALREAKITEAHLADERLEDDPRVRLYWMAFAALTAKVFIEAAQMQYRIPSNG